MIVFTFDCCRIVMAIAAWEPVELSGAPGPVTAATAAGLSHEIIDSNAIKDYTQSWFINRVALWPASPSVT